MNALVKPAPDAVIAAQRPGFSLEQPFYCSEDFFRLDMDCVLSRKWLLVDHVSRIPNPGDYFLFEIGSESIIVVRTAEGRVNAFFNVCRHRGSRICLDAEGNRRTLSCPYHAWVYNLDGSLRTARLMPEGFDASTYNLHPCHVRVYHGLIFLCLSPGDPPDFDALYGGFARTLDFHGFADAKVAVRRNYPNAANWKLVVENFIECYHCAPAHREYCEVHPADQLLALGAGPGSGPQEATEQYQPKLDAWLESTRKLGHPTDEIDEDENTENMAQLVRMPINDRGFLSETRDGSLACRKLMGRFRETDGGETALVFNPVSYILAFNDFAMMVRFTPRDALNTDAELVWLVHKDAEEGKDYDVDHLTWVWDTTIRQDKTITENNQLGVLSSRYRPGPYSDHEARVRTFTAWYLRHLGEGVAGT